MGYSYAAGWEATACPDPAGFVMSGGDAVSQPTDTMIDPATIEARCRRLMRERAALPDRYPHREKRAELRVLIHAELDAYSEASTFPAPDAATSAEPPAPPVTAREGDVFRVASAGEAHDVVTEAGHHRCLRCGAESTGATPALPCRASSRPQP